LVELLKRGVLDESNLPVPRVRAGELVITPLAVPEILIPDVSRTRSAGPSGTEAKES
jgi:hypothetical protein